MPLYYTHPTRAHRSDADVEIYTKHNSQHQHTLLRRLISAYYLLSPAMHYTSDSPHTRFVTSARHTHTKHTNAPASTGKHTNNTRPTCIYSARRPRAVESRRLRATCPAPRPRGVEQQAAAREALLTERVALDGRGP
jgi:hypothetical protein